MIIRISDGATHPTITVAEISERLGICEETVYDMLRNQREQLIAGATTPWGMDLFLKLDAADRCPARELLGLQ